MEEQALLPPLCAFRPQPLSTPLYGLLREGFWVRRHLCAVTFLSAAAAAVFFLGPGARAGDGAWQRNAVNLNEAPAGGRARARRRAAGLADALAEHGEGAADEEIDFRDGEMQEENAAEGVDPEFEIGDVPPQVEVARLPQDVLHRLLPGSCGPVSSGQNMPILALPEAPEMSEAHRDQKFRRIACLKVELVDTANMSTTTSSTTTSTNLVKELFDEVLDELFVTQTSTTKTSTTSTHTGTRTSSTSTTSTTTATSSTSTSSTSTTSTTSTCHSTYACYNGTNDTARAILHEALNTFLYDISRGTDNSTDDDNATNWYHHYWYEYHHTTTTTTTTGTTTTGTTTTPTTTSGTTTTGTTTTGTTTSVALRRLIARTTANGTITTTTASTTSVTRTSTRNTTLFSEGVVDDTDDDGGDGWKSNVSTVKGMLLAVLQALTNSSENASSKHGDAEAVNHTNGSYNASEEADHASEEEQEAEKENEKPRENLVLRAVPGKSVSLHSLRGTYITAWPDGSLSASPTRSDHSQRFIISDAAPGWVSIRTWRGTYLSASPDGTVVANAKAVSAWEEFAIVEDANGRVSFRTAHGTFLSLGTGSPKCPGSLIVMGLGPVPLVNAWAYRPAVLNEEVAVSSGTVTLRPNSRTYFGSYCASGGYSRAQFRNLALLGKTLSFTVDLSRVECGSAVVSLASISRNDLGNCSDYYCDASGADGCGTCSELDIMVADRHSFGAGFLEPAGAEGLVRPLAELYNSNGVDGSCIDTRAPFRVLAAFPATPEGMLKHVRVELSQDSCNDTLVLQLSTYMVARVAELLPPGLALVLSYRGTANAADCNTADKVLLSDFAVGGVTTTSTTSTTTTLTSTTSTITTSTTSTSSTSTSTSSQSRNASALA